MLLPTLVLTVAGRDQFVRSHLAAQVTSTGAAAEAVCCCKEGPCVNSWKDIDHSQDPAGFDTWHQHVLQVPGGEEMSDGEPRSRTWCCREREGSCDNSFFHRNGYVTPASDVPGGDAGLCIRPDCPSGTYPDPSRPDRCLCSNGGHSTWRWDFGAHKWAGKCVLCPDNAVQEAPTISTGTRVKTGGLKNGEFNDKIGTVRSFDEGSGRYVVLFPDLSEKKLKPENLFSTKVTYANGKAVSARQPAAAPTGRCFCKKGYSGPVLKWSEKKGWNGACNLQSCPHGATGHPNCECKMFHTGRVQWQFDHYVGKCNEVECPANFDTVRDRHGALDDEAPCQCPLGTTGTARFEHYGREARFTGTCRRIRCPQSSSREATAADGEAGRCMCVQGAAVAGVRERQIPWNAQTRAFEGSCEYVPCPENASRDDGVCKCDYGWKGDLFFAYSASRWQWEGQCVVDETATGWNRFTNAMGDLFSCNRTTGCDEPPTWTSRKRMANNAACSTCEQVYAFARDTYGAKMAHAPAAPTPVLSPQTTPAQLKNAYRKAAIVLHPDKHAHKDEAAKKRIADLFTTLSSCYDGLANGKSDRNLDRAGGTYIDCCVENPSVYCAPPGQGSMP